MKDITEIKTILAGSADVVIDGGLLLEYLSGTTTTLQTWLNDHLFNDVNTVRLHSHEIARAEVYYITCRTYGTDKAKDITNQLKDYILFHGEFALTEIAGQVKCGHSIALADCFTIAVGHFLNCPILFKEEQELQSPVIASIEQQFGVTILVIQGT